MPRYIGPPVTLDERLRYPEPIPEEELPYIPPRPPVVPPEVYGADLQPFPQTVAEQLAQARRNVTPITTPEEALGQSRFPQYRPPGRPPLLSEGTPLDIERARQKAQSRYRAQGYTPEPPSAERYLGARVLPPAASQRFFPEQQPGLEEERGQLMETGGLNALGGLPLFTPGTAVVRGAAPLTRVAAGLLGQEVRNIGPSAARVGVRAGEAVGRAMEQTARPGAQTVTAGRTIREPGAGLGPLRPGVRLGYPGGKEGALERIAELEATLERHAQRPIIAPERLPEIQNELAYLRRFVGQEPAPTYADMALRARETGAQPSAIRNKAAIRGRIPYQAAAEGEAQARLLERGEQIGFEGERVPFESEIRPDLLPQTVEGKQLSLGIDAGFYVPPGLTPADEATLRKALKSGNQALARKIMRRGQGQLLESRAEYKAGDVISVDPQLVATNPLHQPRAGLDEPNVQRLIDTFDSNRFQPVEVRELSPGNFELIHGHHRLEAAKRLKLPNIPARVLNVSSDEAVRLAEEANLAGKSLTPTEVARILDRRLKLGEEPGAISKAVPGAGVKPGQVEDYARITILPKVAQDAVDSPALSKQFSVQHAMALARAQAKYSIPVDEVQAFFNEVVMKGDLTPSQLTKVLDNFAPVMRQMADQAQMFPGMDFSTQYTGILASIREAGQSIAELDRTRKRLHSIGGFIKEGTEVPKSLARTLPQLERQEKSLSRRIVQMQKELSGQLARQAPQPASRAAEAAKAAEGAGKVVKKPWQMTKDEYLALRTNTPSLQRAQASQGTGFKQYERAVNSILNDHFDKVKAAAENGRVIPPEVQANYPRLFLRAPQPAVRAAQAAPEALARPAEAVAEAMRPEVPPVGIPERVSEALAEVSVPINPDGTVTLYHGTGQEAAQSILSSGEFRLANMRDRNSLFLTTSQANARFHGDTVLAVKVPAKDLISDGGEFGKYADFRIPAQKGYRPAFVTPEVPPAGAVPPGGPVGKPPPTIMPGAKKQRRFPKRVAEMEETPEQIRAGLTEDPRALYDPLANKVTADRAAKLIADDWNAAEAMLRGATEPDAVTAGVGQLLIKEAVEAKNFDRAIDLALTLGERSTQWGQTVQALSMFGKLTPEGILRFAGNVIREAQKVGIGGAKLTAKKAQQLVEAATELQGMAEGRVKVFATQKLLRDIHELVPPSFAAKINMLQIMAQLINPKTAIRNLGGNAMFAAAEQAARAVAVGLDIPISMVTGKRTVTRPAPLTQIKGFGTGLKQGAQEAVAGVSQMPGIFDIPRGRVFRSGVKEALEPGLGIRERAGRLVELPGHYLETLLNLELRVPDRAFFQAAKEESLLNTAKVTAMNEGLTGTARGQRVVELLAKPTDPMLKQGDIDGLYRTFQDETVATALFEGAQKLLNIAGIGRRRGGTGPLAYSREFGLGSFIIRYPRTPAALLTRAVEYSPLGFIAPTLELARMAAGRPFNQRAFVEATGRAIVGTAGLTVAGIMLSKANVVTGRSPADRDLRSLERSVGKGQFRINRDALVRYVTEGFQTQKDKPGDHFVSYDWAQPLAVSFAIGVAVAQPPAKTTKVDRTEGRGNGLFDEMSKDALAGLETFAIGVDSLAQQRMVQGITDLFSTTKDEGPTAAMVEVLSKAPASFVPTLLSQINQAMDNTSRQTYDPETWDVMMNSILAKVPVLAASLPPQVDAWGEDADRYHQDTNNPFNVFVNPAFVSQYFPNAEAEMLLEIARATGEVQHLPRVASKSLTVSDKGITKTYALTAEEYEFYQRTMGTKTRELFSRLAVNENFRNAPAEEQYDHLKEILGHVGSEARAELRANFSEEGGGVSPLPAPTKTTVSRDPEQEALRFEMERLVEEYKGIPKKVEEELPAYRIMLQRHREATARGDVQGVADIESDLIWKAAKSQIKEAQLTWRRTNKAGDLALQRLEGFSAVTPKKPPKPPKLPDVPTYNQKTGKWTGSDAAWVMDVYFVQPHAKKYGIERIENEKGYMNQIEDEEPEVATILRERYQLVENEAVKQYNMKLPKLADYAMERNASDWFIDFLRRADKKLGPMPTLEPIP